MIGSLEQVAAIITAGACLNNFIISQDVFFVDIITELEDERNIVLNLAKMLGISPASHSQQRIRIVSWNVSY